MEPVRSPRNRRVVEAARLHRARERRASGVTIIEGPKLLEEALASGVIPELIFALPDDGVSAAAAARHGIELVTVEAAPLARLAATESPRGPVAVIRVPEPAPIGGRDMIVAWGLTDPGNVGTLIRTAAAFGWGFGHTPGTADPWSPKVLRAGAGGHFRSGVASIRSIDDLHAAGLTTAATVVRGGVAPEDLAAARYALLVGEEADGLPADVVEHAEVMVTITMPGDMESLNAAMAAGMVVYELAKPRGEPGTRV